MISNWMQKEQSRRWRGSWRRLHALVLLRHTRSIVVNVVIASASGCAVNTGGSGLFGLATHLLVPVLPVIRWTQKTKNHKHNTTAVRTKIYIHDERIRPNTIISHRARDRERDSLRERDSVRERRERETDSVAREESNGMFNFCNLDSRVSSRARPRTSHTSWICPQRRLRARHTSDFFQIFQIFFGFTFERNHTTQHHTQEFSPSLFSNTTLPLPPSSPLPKYQNYIYYLLLPLLNSCSSHGLTYTLLFIVTL